MTWCKDRIYDGYTPYYSEEAIIEMLREEFEQANRLIELARNAGQKVFPPFVNIEFAIMNALRRLKEVEE